MPDQSTLTADAEASRPSWRLWLLLYPFTLMAVWINLFMLALLGTWIGLPNLSGSMALLVALFVAIPANHAATRWIHGLLEQASRP
ncbi:MAG: hypothetical protein ACK5II_03045 [Paracoccus sp. (in: a-proteobacteria)]